jgi:hypothetical protein
MSEKQMTSAIESGRPLNLYIDGEAIAENVQFFRRFSYDEECAVVLSAQLKPSYVKSRTIPNNSLVPVSTSDYPPTRFILKETSSLWSFFIYKREQLKADYSLCRTISRSLIIWVLPSIFLVLSGHTM